MKKLLGGLIIVFVVLLNVGHAFGDFNINRWQYYKDVKSESNEYVKLKIDGEIYDHSNFFDLRLVSSNGVETPYQLIKQKLKIARNNKFEIYNLSTKSGTTQFYVQLANSKSLHSGIEITAKDDNYKRIVSIEGSNDQKEWRLLKKSYIFALSEDGFVTRKKQVGYPKSNYNYLRVTIDNQNEQPLDINQEVVVNFVEKERIPPIYSRISSIIKVKNKGDKTTIKLKLKHATPVKSIKLNINNDNYDRLIRVFSDKEDWLKDTNIYSYKTDLINEINNNIILDQAVVTKNLTIIVYNQDDQPLKINKADVFAEQRYVVFKGAGSFRLFYGNKSASEPSYDLAKTISYLNLTHVDLGTASREKINHLWQKPKKPWSEDNRWVLILVIAIAVLLLGSLVVKQLVNTSQTKD